MGKVGKVGDCVRFCEIGYWEEWSDFLDVAMSHNTSVFLVEMCFVPILHVGKYFTVLYIFCFCIVYSARGGFYFSSFLDWGMSAWDCGRISAYLSV